MFLISLKSLKGKFILLAAIVVATVIGFTVLSSSESSDASPADGALNYSAGTEAERISFISQLGLTVNEEPDSVTQFIIPQQFDTVYEEYNKIQINAGLDLTPYKGCTVKRWTYTVSDFPQYENSNAVKINLIIYNNRIIGGDICSLEIDGFMLPLTNQEQLWQKNDLTN